MHASIPELLIPAGSLRKLRVALAYGADAVYVGAAGFSMRPDGASFPTADLRLAVDEVHRQGKRIYVALNSLIHQDGLPALHAWLDETVDIAMDALIVADPAALLLVRQHRPEVEIHISTQLSTANALAARFWQAAGASRVILARECTLDEVKQIAAESGVPIEIFVHGAMCVAVSGRCLLSAYMTGHSASEGECKHSCRWDWQLVEAKRPGEAFPVFETGKETIVLSSTDLCLIEHIPRVVRTGAASLKIEGRMKGEYYVAVVTRVYRAALDAYAADPLLYRTDPAWLAELHSLRHHPYATGFAFGYPAESPEVLQARYIDIGTHDVVGIVEGREEQAYRVLVKHPFRYDATLEWIGPGYAGGTVTIDSIQDQEGQGLNQTHPGTTVLVRLASQADIPLLAMFRRRKPVEDTLRQR